MFGPKIGGFSLSKVISNLSNTLNTVNQIIPIYKEAKPAVENMRNALSYFKKIGLSSSQRIISNTKKNMLPIKEKINTLKSVNHNNPTFFQ